MALLVPYLLAILVVGALIDSVLEYHEVLVPRGVLSQQVCLREEFLQSAIVVPFVSEGCTLGEAVVRVLILDGCLLVVQAHLLVVRHLIDWLQELGRRVHEVGWRHVLRIFVLLFEPMKLLQLSFFVFLDDFLFVAIGW